MISSAFSSSKVVFTDVGIKENFVILFSDSESTILVSCKSDGLIYVDINTNLATITNNDIEDIKHNFLKLSWCISDGSNSYKTLPSITRDQGLKNYDVGAGGQIIQYDFTKVVFEDKSDYQKVRIMHSNQFGNCLYLDDDLNLAESDLSYTVAITGSDKEDYKNKDVLILGGGDGGILNYLKDKGAKMITMVEIDQMVLDAAKIHLRKICGNSMDKSEGQNYKIIVDDCVKWLKKFASENRKFDYIINDLTAIPVSTSPVGDLWDFLKQILALSFDVLSSNGKYFTQGNSALCQSALSMYEEQLKKLDCPVSFSKELVCVPSYMEMWVFYTIWKNCN